MEFKISVQELQVILSKLSHVVKMSTNDISSMVFVKSKDKKKLEFEASNGSVSISIEASNFEIIKEGKALFKLIDIKGYIFKFIQFADGYGTDVFHFIIDKPDGIIKTKTSFGNSKPSYRRLKFDLQDESSFSSPKPFGKDQFVINSSILKREINRVLHCINPSEIRNALRGLKLTIKDNKVFFAGSNGIKLAESASDMTTDIKEGSYIFKHDVASILVPVLEEDVQVFISVEGRYVYLRSDGIYIIGGLIIGEQYPDYQEFFKFDKTITFPKADFVDSIEAAIEVTDDEDNNRITLNFTDNVLTLKNEQLDITHKFDESFGANLDVDVNSRFLLELLKSFTSDYLMISFIEGYNYILLRSSESGYTSLLTLVKRR